VKNNLDQLDHYSTGGDNSSKVQENVLSMKLKINAIISQVTAVLVFIGNAYFMFYSHMYINNNLLQI